ncbi:MAG: hypothetical protein WBG71_13020 [Leeuwenhoekiella sp.]
MDSDQRIAITDPATGLLVYDTDLDAFYYYDGSVWAEVGSAAVASNANDYTGWADYVDTQYTSAAPFTGITTTPARVSLPNNAGIIQDGQKPVDISTFYDSTTGTITGRDGDGVNIVIEFKARPTNTNIPRITVAIDIGGAVGEIYKRDFILSKGAGVEHFYLSSFNAYTLNTWEANGGTVKISSTFPVEVYDIRYIVTRTHRAR